MKLFMEEIENKKIWNKSIRLYTVPYSHKLCAY